MKRVLPNKLSVFLITFFLNFSTLLTQAQVTNYASIPYYQGFESGVLDSNWYTNSSIATGRIRIWPSDTLIWGGDTAMAYAGNNFLGMDMPAGGTFNLNQAQLGLNTSGASNLFLSFWWSDWNDETSPDDGIYISDNGGSTFTKVLDLLGANNPDLNWVFFNLNLDSINAIHNLNYGPTYVIKFQQYDDYYLAGGNDGFLFDEINISGTVTSIDKVSTYDVKLFPNPFNEVIYINTLNNNSPTNINVYNMLGELILSSYFPASEPVKLNLNIESGVYNVEIITDSQSIVKRVVKN